MTGEWTNHLWQSTWFAVAAGLLTLLFRSNRAGVRYWLWFSASLKFLLPFWLLMTIGGQLQWSPAAKSVVRPAVSFAVVEISQPFTVFPMSAAPPPATHDWLTPVILFVWACGCAALVLIRFRGWLRLRAAVRASTPIDLPVPVDVNSTPGLLEPGVVGLFRPRLLLPAGIAERLTPPQLEAVVAHELCHVRRRDNLTSAIHMMVEAIFWFHPLVWWIGARLVEERERACDEAVLSLGSEPHDYAEGILNVCKHYVESPLACVSGVTGSDLKKRIHAILSRDVGRSLSFAKKAALAIAGITALAVPVMVGVMKVPALRAQSVAPASKFEVASIKPCKPGDSGGLGRKGIGTKAGGAGPGSSPGRLSTGCNTVGDLIHSAYILYRNGYLERDPSNPPLEGGPAWIDSARYQIDAKADGASGAGVMNGPMMRSLLEDRFKLKIHRESREVPVYALTIAKGGPKLGPFREGSCVPVEAGNATRPENACRAVIAKKGPNLAVEGQGSTLRDIAKLLYLILDRPIIDRTGLQGRFDVHLEFAPEETTPVFRPRGEPPPPLPAAPTDEPAGPSIFVAIEKELGLKLDKAKGPRDFFVIDHVERPSGN